MPPIPLLKVAAAYIRVSDERQDEYSPDSQLKKTREFAAREGYMIPDEYVFYDDGISAKSAKRRKEFNRMIAMAKEKDHPFDAIYVWKFSRFARNQEESMVYKNLLRKKGVSVISVSEPIPEGPFGTLIERIIEWMDEFYLVNLSTEVTRGMTEKASRGEPTCAPPYGYVMRDKQYYPDESGPADVIREVFRRYASGEGQRAIAVSLGERGIRTKFGGMPDNRWIEYILNNPCYIGKIRWSLDGARAVSKRDYVNSNIWVIDGHHEPLISDDLWDAVQQRIAEQKKLYPAYARKEQPMDHMLKGLVRCSSCGGTLAISGRSGKSRVPCLQCCNYAKGTCHESHGVTLPKIEATMIEGLEEAVGNMCFHIVPHKPEKATADTPDYDKLIALEERKLDRAKAAFLAEIDTIEQYAANKKAITERITDLKRMRDSTTAPTAFDAHAFSMKVKQVIDFLREPSPSPAAKNEALRAILEKVVYDKVQNRLSIYFHE